MIYIFFIFKLRVLSWTEHHLLEGMKLNRCNIIAVKKSKSWVVGVIKAMVLYVCISYIKFSYRVLNLFKYHCSSKKKNVENIMVILNILLWIFSWKVMQKTIIWHERIIYVIFASFFTIIKLLFFTITIQNMSVTFSLLSFFYGHSFHPTQGWLLSVIQIRSLLSSIFSNLMKGCHSFPYLKFFDL